MTGYGVLTRRKPLMNAHPNSPSPEQIVFLIPGALIAPAGFGHPGRDPYAPERQRGEHMENCVYCEKPLAETERVRWYSEHVHSECYEALLAEAVAIIVTEQPAQDYRKEMMSGIS
jgi:hypothetical protein